MVTKTIPYFNLRKIMNSGQIFRMYEPEADRFVVFSGNKRLELYQHFEHSDGEKGPGTEIGTVDFMCSQKEFEDYWEDYFDLKRDYGAIVQLAQAHYDKVKKSESLAIKEGINGAEFLKKSCEYGADIRVLKQDIWEMMISFIISQQKQIPSIRKCIEALCTRFGENHSSWYGFPTPESIASAGPDGVKGLSLGYRERYIYETAVKYLMDGIPDDKLRIMPADEVKKYLCSFTGIGDKVADCVALFGVGLVDSFPIDVHIKDILYREFVSDKDKLRIGKNIKNRNLSSETIKSSQDTKDLPRKKLLDSISYSDYMQIISNNFSALDGIKGIVQQWIFAYEIAK